MRKNLNSSDRTSKMIAYMLIGLTILFTVCGQLLVKAGMIKVGPFAGELKTLPIYVFKALTNVKVFAGLLLAVFAALTWMGAISKLKISFAYPFMSLAIVLVLALSGIVFRERVPVSRWIGVAIVCVGLIVSAL
jgi:drug/metabolite transporter (DMT)-like permease